MNIVQCAFCVHLSSNRVNDKRICNAFPDGIPDEIILGEYDHREEHPEDNGIRFEQDPNKTELY